MTAWRYIIVNIEGSTIRLRDIQLADLDTYRHWQQPGHAWQALDGPYYPKATSEQVDKLIDRLKERIAADDWSNPRTRLMIADKQSDTLFGTVTRYWISEETSWSAVGIVIFDPSYWRQGIGYQALGMWIDYLFKQFPAWVRLDLRTWSGNHGMVGLATKLGYREEARFRKARIVNGEYFDGLGFGILRDEWQTQFPNGFD